MPHLTNALALPPVLAPVRKQRHRLVAAPAPAQVRVSARVADRLSSREHDDRGITTAEYAVGTAAGAGLAGLLYTMLSGGFGDKLLKTLFDHVLSLLGVG